VHFRIGGSVAFSGVRGLFFLSLILFLVSGRGLAAESLEQLSQRLSQSLQVPASTGVAVADVQTGQILFQRNQDNAIKPASVLKLLTTAAAFEKMGPGYRFRTPVLVEGLRGSRAEALTIQGGGDPSFTIEDLWMIARRVRLRGIRSVGQLVLDPGGVVEGVDRTGQRPYQAGTSALPLNFNTVTFEICPTTAGQPARIAVDPPEYPIQIEGVIRTIAQGSGQYGVDEFPGSSKGGGAPRFRVTGTIGHRVACVSVYRTVSNPEGYLGITLRSLLDEQGVRVENGPFFRSAGGTASILFRHESKPLADILRDLNHYSSNFIAEQIVLALSSHQSDLPAEHSRGLGEMAALLSRIDAGHPGLSLHDGSGLSHDNRISAAALLKLLLHVVQQEDYNVEFENSLAVGGRSGTLRRRSMPGVVRAKTGTLTGVTSLAGYISNQSGRKFAFVVLQNNTRSRADAFRFEERLLGVLRSSTL